MIKKIIKKLDIIVLSFSMIVFLAILEDVLEKELMKGDIYCYKILMKYIRSDFLTVVMKVITNMGSAIVIILITIILLLVLNNKRKSICIAMNAIIITFINQLVKILVQRPRPDGYRLIEESGYSFPSGHSMVSMAFFGFLIYLVYKYVENKYLKYGLCIVLCLFILLIGFSRIYLGVHYLSDVVGGYFISLFYLIIYIKLVKSYIDKGEIYEK